MNERQRRAQITAVEGRFVRSERNGPWYVVVVECPSADALGRSKKALTGKGWTHVRTSGLSMMLKVQV